MKRAGAFLLSTPGAAPMASAQAPQRPTTTVRISGAVPEYHVVHRGDTLWDISGYYFANPWDWPRVWGMNPEIANPHWIYPDDRVRLRDTVAAPARVAGLRVVGGGGGARGPRPSGGTIWLRNIGFIDDHALEQSGTIVGSPEARMLLSQYDGVYVSCEGEGHGPPPRTPLPWTPSASLCGCGPTPPATTSQDPSQHQHPNAAPP